MELESWVVHNRGGALWPVFLFLAVLVTGTGYFAVQMGVRIGRKIADPRWRSQSDGEQWIALFVVAGITIVMVALVALILVANIAHYVGT